MGAVAIARMPSRGVISSAWGSVSGGADPMGEEIGSCGDGPAPETGAIEVPDGLDDGICCADLGPGTDGCDEEAVGDDGGDGDDGDDGDADGNVGDEGVDGEDAGRLDEESLGRGAACGVTSVVSFGPSDRGGGDGRRIGGGRPVMSRGPMLNGPAGPDGGRIEALIAGLSQPDWRFCSPGKSVSTSRASRPVTSLGDVRVKTNASSSRAREAAFG